MSVAAQGIEEEPPLGRAATLVAKASRFLLVVICAGPIAVFPIGLVYKGYRHFISQETPPLSVPTWTASANRG